MSNEETLVPQEQQEVITPEGPIFIMPTPEERVAYITSVKISGGGYFVNGEMSVPKADGNRHYEDIKLWLELGNTPEDEFTSDELELQRVASIKSEAGRIISERYPAYKQQNVALGLETKAYSDAMIKFIKDIKDQSTKLEKDKKKTSADFVVGA